MSILILGSCGSGKQIAAALALSLAAKQTEVIAIDSIDDIEPGDGDILICDDNEIIFRDVYCGHPMGNIGADIEPCTDDSYDDGKQHWRGGSRGKGGKIKYRRG